MKKLFIFFLMANLIFCTTEETEKELKKSHPSHVYKFVSIDSSLFQYHEIDYVPVYSDIYQLDGTRRYLLTTTVSIRNTSLTDSAFILKATYHDSYGKILKEYTEQYILLSPLESIEFVVDEFEDMGGAGANFIVEWAAKEYGNQLLIQAVMIGTYGKQGVSFLSEAKIIKQVFRK